MGYEKEEGVMVMVSCVDVAARPPVVMLVIWYRLLLTVGALFLGALCWIGLAMRKKC